MDNPFVSDLLSISMALFLIQVAIFSLPPFYIVTLNQPLRSSAFYIYVSIVLLIGGFLGAVYSIPLTESITISGGNLAYGALMYSAILLVVVEGDVFAIRNVVRLVITVNVLKYLLFSVFSWSLRQNTILNPFDTAPELFAVSAKFMIIGGFLIILELLILLFFFEKIKSRVKNYYVLSVFYIVCFVAVLLLDGVLFPLIAFGINSSLVSIVVGGITGKLVMAAAYSLPLLAFIFIFHDRLTTYFATPIEFGGLLNFSREKLIDEIGRQQQSIAQQEEALWESEERLRLALEAAKQGLYDLNLRDSTAVVNDQYALMLGYDPETFVETNVKWSERLHPEDQERVTQYLQAYLAGEIPEYRIDFRQKAKDGNWIWISSLGKIVSHDSQGKPLRMLGTHTNVTNRKVAERSQQRSEARYRALFEYSPVSLWEEDFSEVKQAIDLLKREGVSDFETYLQQNKNVLQKLANKVKVLDVNQRTLALYKVRDKAQLLGYLKIINPGLLHNFISQMVAVAKGDKTLKFTSQTYTADGELLDIVLEWTVQPGHEEDYGRVLVSIVDISAVVQAEKTLAENRRRLQALFDHSQDAILLADDQAHYVDVNPAACELTGYSREKLLQSTIWDISPGGQEPQSLGLWQQFIATGKMGGEFVVQHKDGRLIQTEFRAVANIAPGLHLSIMRDITEQKQAEIALESSEKKYRNLVETSHDLIWAIDGEARITFMNQAAHRIYGRSPEEMIGRFYTDFIPPEQIEANAQSWVNAGENDDRILDFENWVLHKDGTPVCLSANAVLLRDEQNNIVGSIGSSKDITKRKETERQLQYQAFLLDNVSEAIISTDLNFNVLTWNHAAEWLYGWQAEEVVGKPLESIVAPQYPNDENDSVVQAIMQNGRWQGEVIHICQDGSHRYMLSTVNILKDDAGEPVGTVSVNRDISDRKKIELALQNAKNILEQTLNSLQDAVFVIDPLSRKIITCNPAVEPIFGYTPDELIGQDTAVLYATTEDFQRFGELSEPVLEQNGVFHTEYKMQTKDGDTIITENTVMTLDETGSWQNGVVSVVRDITERKRVEKQIKRTELLLKEMSTIAKVGGWEVDLVTMEPSFTEETFRIYELPPTQPPKLEDGILYYSPESRPLIEKAVQEAIEENWPYDLEVPFITAKGRNVWVRTQGRVYLEEGKAVRLYGSIQDITERKQAEEQLQEYTQRLETLRQIDRAILFQNSPDRVAEVVVHYLAQMVNCDRLSAGYFDESGETATVLAVLVKEGSTSLEPGQRVPMGDNPAAIALLQQGKTHMLPDLSLFANNSLVIDQLLKEGLRSYMTVPLIAGERLIGTLSLGSKTINYFDENHELLVKEVANQLAIALYQAHLHEAEQSQRRLAETLQQTAVTLVGTLKLKETLTTILDQLALVVSYDLAQVLLIQGEMLTIGARQGTLIEDGMIEEERPYTRIPLLNQSLQSGKPFILTASQIKQNHLDLPGIVPALSSWVGIPLISRDIAVGFLTIGQVDTAFLPKEINAINAFAQQAALAIEKATILSELEKSLHTLRETQAQMVRAVRLSTIGETAAGVAHQINNPLTTVILDSHLLLKNLPTSHPARQSAEAIHQAALRAANVVERLLDFSRTIPTIKKQIDISNSVMESVTLVKAQLPENIHLDVNIGSDLPLIEASAEHLHDVWVNLLLNARDAVRQQEKGIITVSIVHDILNNSVNVSIQDNGVGIPHDKQEKIFEPFYTTKQQGTGLGLAVCLDIVVHHNGEIRVRSKEGQETTFTIILPV